MVVRTEGSTPHLIGAEPRFARARTDRYARRIVRRLTLAVVTAALLISTLQVGLPAARAGTKATTSYYVALGDSLAAGFQPSSGLTRRATSAMSGGLPQQIPGLSLRNLGCPGETTAR